MNWPHQKLFIDEICRKVSAPNLYQQFFCKNLCFHDVLSDLICAGQFVEQQNSSSKGSFCSQFYLIYFHCTFQIVFYEMNIPLKEINFQSILITCCRPLNLPNCLKIWICLWKKLMFNQFLSLAVRPIAEQTVSGKHEDEKNRIKGKTMKNQEKHETKDCDWKQKWQKDWTKKCVRKEPAIFCEK